MAYASVVIVTILQACFLEWDMHVCAMEKPSKKINSTLLPLAEE
jgi:hypothetical protein